MPNTQDLQADPKSEASSVVVQLEDLKLDPANVRTHDAKNIEAITASLKQFGQQKPVVVDAEGVVIAGNGTVLAAKAMGWASLWVTRSTLTGHDKRAYAIADNRTAELAAWDTEALAAALSGLQNADGINELVTGFTSDQIESMVSGMTGPGEFSEVDEDIEINSTCPKCGYKWSGGT